MNDVFSCRNCIHNCSQSLNTGRGAGYCLKHDSVIAEPERTTCKYLHRKDLPQFVVSEGIREHAAEFALFPRLVTLDTKEPLDRIHYSERHYWETREFDPLTHALAQYFKAPRRWVLIQAFTGGTDGRRSLAHASLIRHYMDQCDTWTSAYRLVLGLLEEIDEKPCFTRKALVSLDGLPMDDVETEALWDIVFVRLSAIQEYGWHAGLESLIWITDTLNGSLVEFDWPGLQKQLTHHRDAWSELIISHAKSNDAFFPKRESEEEVNDE